MASPPRRQGDFVTVALDVFAKTTKSDSVWGTADDFSKYFDAPQKYANRIQLTRVTDQNLINITYTQFIADQALIAKFNDAAFRVSKVAIANLTSVETNAKVASVDVSDNTANVAIKFADLAKDSKVATISFTDAAPVLCLKNQQFHDGAAALKKITGVYSFIAKDIYASDLASLASYSQLATVTVKDTLRSIVDNLDSEQIAIGAKKLTNITATDFSQTGPYYVPITQYNADKNAVSMLPKESIVTTNTVQTRPVINLIFDKSFQNEPDFGRYKAAISYAADQLSRLILDPISLNFRINAQHNGDNKILAGAGSSTGLFSFDYVTQKLKAHYASANESVILPAADPTHGAGVRLTNSEQRLLGILPATAPPDAIDSNISFNLDSKFNTDTTHRATGAQLDGYDMVGVAYHELTHALGRAGNVGATDKTVNLFDLFRYENGQLNTQAIGNGYFSDQGGRNLYGGNFEADDSADWAANPYDAPFDADGYGNYHVSSLYSVDIKVLQALGYHTAPGVTMVV